jgi:hypothetical protein
LLLLSVQYICGEAKGAVGGDVAGVVVHVSWGGVVGDEGGGGGVGWGGAEDRKGDLGLGRAGVGGDQGGRGDETSTGKGEQNGEGHGEVLVGLLIAPTKSTARLQQKEIACEALGRGPH